MILFKLLYYLLLLICFVVSFLPNRKADKSMIIFPILLGLSIVVEGLAYLLHVYKIQFNVIYHLYVPVEYALLAAYFYMNVRSLRIRKIIQYSIPVYFIISLAYSMIGSFQRHPGLQINMEGLLLIVWAIFSLFSIEAREGTKIHALPIFWICIGVLIYHSGIFTYTGIYNYIVEQKTALGGKLNIYILQISNYILYICWSIAFICSHQTKK